MLQNPMASFKSSNKHVLMPLLQAKEHVNSFIEWKHLLSLNKGIDGSEYMNLSWELYYLELHEMQGIRE